MRRRWPRTGSLCQERRSEARLPDWSVTGYSPVAAVEDHFFFQRKKSNFLTALSFCSLQSWQTQTFQLPPYVRADQQKLGPTVVDIPPSWHLKEEWWLVQRIVFWGLTVVFDTPCRFGNPTASGGHFKASPPGYIRGTSSEVDSLNWSADFCTVHSTNVVYIYFEFIYLFFPTQAAVMDLVESDKQLGLAIPV